MDTESFFDLIRAKRFDDAHKHIDSELVRKGERDIIQLNHRRTTVFLSEKRYNEALQHLLANRTKCGPITHTHETIAMIYEITGQDDLALAELESAPFDEEEPLHPLLVADTRFYRLFFRAKRNLPVTEQELDAFPPDYETYLPANGHMRGLLVKKDDIMALTQARQNRNVESP